MPSTLLSFILPVVLLSFLDWFSSDCILYLATKTRTCSPSTFVVQWTSISFHFILFYCILFYLFFFLPRHSYLFFHSFHCLNKDVPLLSLYINSLPKLPFLYQEYFCFYFFSDYFLSFVLTWLSPSLLTATPHLATFRFSFFCKCFTLKPPQPSNMTHLVI